MLSFDFGNLIVLVAVVVILIVYRQLDKNNRSLEKIRKYAETVRHDLNEFVEERTAAVQDFETVLKVHDKTAAEILRRIQAVEAHLLTRLPEVEQMQARLDRYAATMTDLEAQTGRVDANIDRLKEEAVFVDRVSQRIKGAGDQMTALEDDFVRIRQEFADINAKDLETVRKNAFETFERETFTYVQQLREAQKQVDGFQTFVTDLEARQQAAVAAFEAQQRTAADEAGRRLSSLLTDTERTLADRAQALVEGAEAAFARSATQADDLSSDIFVRLEQRIEDQASAAENRLRADLAAREEAVRQGLEALGQRLSAVDQKVAEGTETLGGLLAQVRLETEVVQSRTKDDIDTLDRTLREASAALRDEFKLEQAQLLGLTAQLKSDLEARLAEVRRQAQNEAEALKVEFQSNLEVDRQAGEALALDVRQFVSEARQETLEAEQRTIEALEARLRDYETGFAYRYGKMEEAEKDIASLDQNLRQAMDRVAARIQADFAAFDEAMARRRQEEQEALERKIEASQASMLRLDKDLEELKARAYDNVGEKLQGFEEEFFQDLQKRNASMAQSLEDWQAGLQAQLEDLKTAAERERAEAERVVSEALKARIQELQNASFQQLDRLERQIHEAQESTGASVRSYRDEVEETRTRLVADLADLEKSLGARFEQDRAKAELAAGESLAHLERDLETRMRALGDELEQYKAEYRTGLDGAQAEFALWQTKYSQRFKELEADLGDQYRTFKASLAEKITGLSDEFSLQKEELITRSAEDRIALRTDLSQIKAAIEDLESQLRSRAQAASEAFEREYETQSQDFQKRNRDLASDIENKIRDYRSSVNDTRAQAEAMQKKLFGRIEDQANLLTVGLEEIEKRQKGFVAQTKVFERADALKQELQEAIEDLKGDLARIEVQRKDLFEIESSIARVKKLGDETSDKAAKFAAEKKRIDLMDADFQRILSLSQSMELRLEQVTGSHDLLQDIQLRIRKLEDYSKDIEVRYERLEKRREVLDNTTDGVDRNFALLEKIEKAVRGLETELKTMPGEVEELRKRLKTLAQGKDDADVALDRLLQLDKTLQDVEGRIGRMEKAREWIAGVETRLTETKAAAEEQVQTLATITKAAGNPAAKGRTADADLRQTVLKLARQGWGKEEISRATKLSLGEVELILELGAR